MKTEVTKTKSYEKKVLFELSPEEMADFRKKAFAKVKQSAKINGFRQGKAPVAVIEKMYGRAIDGEAIEIAVDETFRNFLLENKIMPLTQAKIEDMKTEENDELKFTAVIEVHPEFELGKYTDLEVEKKIVTVEEDEMKARLDAVLDEFATRKPHDGEIENGCVCKLKFKLKGAPEEQYQEREVEIGKHAAEREVDEQIIGLKKGDTKVLEVKNPQGEVQNELDILVVDVEKKELPELTDDFVKTIDKKYESLDQFKSEIEKEIKKGKERQSEMEMLERLRQAIVEEHESLDVPPSILDGYLNDLAAQAKQQYGNAGIDDEMIKNLYREGATRSLKWQYIKQEIAKAEEIQVKPEDIDAKYEKIAAESKVSMDKIKAYYGNPEKQNMVINDILEDKIDTFLKEKNEIKEVEKLKEEIEAEAKKAEEEKKEEK